MHIKHLTVPGPGYDLAADWYEGKDTTHIVLVLPGYTSAAANQEELITEVLQRTKYSALVFDRSGHGQSPIKLASTRPAQHVLETVCVFDWLVQQYPQAAISVMGNSYGSYMGANLAKHRDFKTLVLRAPAIYTPVDFYRKQEDIDRPGAVQDFRHDPSALAKHPVLAPGRTFTGKTFVLAHAHDEVVPKDTSDAYAAAFDATIYTAPAFGHTFDPSAPLKAQQEYHDTLARWLTA